MAGFNDKIYAIGLTNISLANGATLTIPQAPGCIRTVISDVSGGTLILTGTGSTAAPSVSVANGKHIGAGYTVEGPAGFIVGCAGGTAAFKLERQYTQGNS